jgi:ABC-2 type transport system permease protein
VTAVTQARTGLGLGEFVQRRELLGTLVERQLRLRAKRSMIGVVWPLLSPLFLLALYSFVFSSVFDVPVEEYGVYLFAGLLPWTFLVQTANDSLQSISFEPDLVRRAPMPYHFLPLARVVVMAIPFLVLLGGLIVYVALASDAPFDPALLPWLVLPVSSVILLVATVAMLLALIDVFNRDLRFVLNNLLTVWFYLVPIVYHRRMVSDEVQRITAIDPMHWIVEQFRDVLYDGHVDDPLLPLLTLLASAAVFLGGLWLFRRWAVDLAKDV